MKARLAADETLSRQVVDERHHVAAIDGAAAAEVRLAGGPELVDRRQEGDVRALRTEGPQRLGHQALSRERSLVQQPAR